MSALAIISILLALAFLCLQSWLVACEVNFVRLRHILLKEEEAVRIRAHGSLRYLLDTKRDFSLALRFGRVWCTLAFGVFLFPLFKGVFIVFSGSWGGQFLALALLFVMVIGCYFIVAVWAPRSVDSQQPERFLARSAWPLIGWYYMSWPLLTIICALGRKVLGDRVSSVGASLNLAEVDMQIAALYSEEKPLSSFVRSVFSNALRMSELEVSDVVLPRSQVEYFDLNEPIEENIRIAIESSHTRFPLCQGDLDRVLGIIHIKDLFREKAELSKMDLRKFRRKTLRIGSAESLEDAFQKLIRNKVHMAIVIDDFGGTIGVLTLEAILEELVGDIQDEFDIEESWITALSAQRYRVSGLVPLHDLEEALDVFIENDAVSTFGGLITQELGRIPEKGETLELNHLKIVVDEVDEKRVISAIVSVLPKGIVAD